MRTKATRFPLTLKLAALLLAGAVISMALADMAIGSKPGLLKRGQLRAPASPNDTWRDICGVDAPEDLGPSYLHSYVGPLVTTKCLFGYDWRPPDGYVYDPTVMVQPDGPTYAASSVATGAPFRTLRRAEWKFRDECGGGDSTVVPARALHRQQLYAGVSIDWWSWGANTIFWACSLWFAGTLGLRTRQLLRERAASKQGRCPRCKYDLRGETDAGCPECGWNRPAEGEPASEVGTETGVA